MNVLVYSGPEVLETSLDHALSTLRSILSPHYSVQTITQQALSVQPWSPTCVLLVFPALREAFVSSSLSIIDSYLQHGGAFLGLGTAARYEAGRGILSFKPTGNSKEDVLRFFDKTSGGYLYPTFSTVNETLARSVSVLTSEITAKGLPHNRGVEFVGVEEAKNVKVLAKFVETEGEGVIAAVKCEVGKGLVILWAPNLENSFLEPASAPLPSGSNNEWPNLLEQCRRNAFCHTLQILGLKIPSPDAFVISRPLPQFIISQPSQPTIVSRILESLAAPSLASQLSVFEDENDTFHFHPLAESATTLHECRAMSRTHGSHPSTWQPKHIIVCQDGELPDPNDTPLFDLKLYFKSLSIARRQEGCIETTHSWGMGEALLYGEAVTSTQTIFDKNPRFMGLLQTPLLSIASHQLSGRGRGSNVWLTPSGSLSMSLLLRPTLTNLLAQKLVFVQYLFALAVVEACRDDGVMGEWGKCIRLKWPNDLYAVVGDADGEGAMKKIGGILVNTSFRAGKVEMVVGCGLNIRNTGTATSLAQLLSPDLAENLSLERTAAIVMAKFERMWTTFVAHQGSFDPFMDLYLERWLHSDQLVTLTTVSPPQKVRITGITADHGLLRTVPERDGRGTDQGFIDLQPDGNSFDMMANMIKTKT